MGITIEKPNLENVIIATHNAADLIIIHSEKCILFHNV